MKYEVRIQNQAWKGDYVRTKGGTAPGRHLVTCLTSSAVAKEILLELRTAFTFLLFSFLAADITNRAYLYVFLSLYLISIALAPCSNLVPL